VLRSSGEEPRTESALSPGRGSILVVDDTPANLDLLTRMLRKQGYTVHAACEGPLALRFLRTTLPDLVLLDIMMPGMDGYEVCARLRADERTAGIPVIFISSADHVIDKVRAFSCGAVDYVVKPFQPEEVLARIGTHLSLRDLRRDLESRVRERTAELVDTNVQLHREIAERRRAEDAALRSAAEISQLYNQAPCGYHSLDEQGTVVRINDTELAWLGRSRPEVLGKMKMVELIAPEDRERFEAHLAAVTRGQEVRDLEYHLIHKDGSAMPVLLNANAVADAAGRFLMTSATVTNIAARKSLEQQLRQSQKMEAIGRLAGGIAHDFNNLLTVILGYSKLALGRLSPSDILHEQMEEIRKAGQRASALTNQLLAFSRRQILRPQLLDLNSVVAEMDKMLRRLIGEPIDLLTVPDPGLGQVRADPGQIEQVIMNLAVNARDAMPLGGKLTIETLNVELAGPSGDHPSVAPGSYVMLAISDTGDGIDENIKAQIFEPFFTTKGTGKGTGLGLSTVYGIVSQSGGQVAVHSEKGRGTSFRIYLPRVEGRLSAIESRTRREEVTGGEETILLVEDEESVRTLTRDVLRDAGYSVLEATDPDQALWLCQAHPGPIDLLVTDVIMPRLNGPALASRVSQRRPHIRVLYISGYSENERGVLAAAAFLQKPFTPDDLRDKIRQVLDSERTTA
jgi:two-component system, cell cycle sensor histidine kinase and response regulator CckA